MADATESLSQTQSRHAAHASHDDLDCLERLEHEVASLTQQVARDFEELALLQSLAMVPLRCEAQNPFGMAMDWLPQLPLTTLCESVAVIPNAEMFVPWELGVDGGQVIWSDRAILDDEQCQGVVQQYRQAASQQPVVVNLVHDPRWADQVSGFVLVEIRHAERLCGWLLAINHINPTRADNPNDLGSGFTSTEASLITTVASILAAQLYNVRMLQQKEQMFTDVVRAMVNAVEARDEYTCGHSERVALFARELAHAAGLSAHQCQRIYLSGLLHDVGKIAVPDSVLRKPGRLDDQERQIIETHPEAGWRILHPLAEQLSDVLPGVVFHHERIDGTGYPDQLQGDAIPLDGRILAICDAYDAMTSDRPYRKGLSQETAETILKEGAGSQWDTHLIERFFDIMPAIIDIRKTYFRREARSRTPGSHLPQSPANSPS